MTKHKCTTCNYTYDPEKVEHPGIKPGTAHEDLPLGVLKGEFMLGGFKSLNFEKQYIHKFVMLYENINDPTYVRRFETFEGWYEHTINLPGRWYLQVVKELLNDDLTPKEQVLNAQEHLGTKKSELAKDIANGGHIGLFMGKKPLLENWPKIAQWKKEPFGHMSYVY